MVHAATYSSRTDALTGLYNRKEFNKQVNRFIEENNPISVIFVDIDNFKKLNDTQGHAKGDEELRGVAKIISEETSGIGIAGRYGGEEMVVLITDCNVHLATVCENIRSRVEKEMIVTLSIGYSQSTDEIKGDQLIKQADEAMYKAKTTGKNKVVGWA